MKIQPFNYDLAKTRDMEPYEESEDELNVAEQLLELEERIESILEKVKEEFKDKFDKIDGLSAGQLEIAQKIVTNILKDIKGDPGTDSKPEDVATKLLANQEFLEKVKGEPGTNGTDYELTESDKLEIAESIEVPVVEKVIERREVVREIPIVKEVAKKDAPGEIRDKIESLPTGKKLSIQSIEDLPKILEDLSELYKTYKNSFKGGLGLLKGGVHAGKGKEIRFIDDETPIGVIDGSNAIFTLSKVPINGSLKVYRGGARQKENEDYMLSGKVITFIIAPVVGEVILTDYRY